MIQYLFFFVWLTSFSTIISRSIQPSSILNQIYTEAARLNQRYVLYGGSLSFEEPSGLPHSPRETGVLENHPAQKNTEEKAFPLSFLGLANSWSHAGNGVVEKGKRLLLPEIPISSNWRLLYLSHPDFCLKVFSTVARCCWVSEIRFLVFCSLHSTVRAMTLSRSWARVCYI